MRRPGRWRAAAGALLAYSLPLFLLLAGALLGQVAFAGAGEEPVVLSGVLGLGLGFLAVRVLSKRFQDDSRFQPRVLRRAPEYWRWVYLFPTVISL